MVNGLHLSSSFVLGVLKALYILMPQTSTHSHTDGGGYYIRCQPAHQERLGVQCLTQRHFDTWHLSQDRINNRPIAEQLLYLLNHCEPLSTINSIQLSGARSFRALHVRRSALKSVLLLTRSQCREAGVICSSFFTYSKCASSSILY